MTKIYLVSFKDKKSGLTVNNVAFTNFKKAMNYKRYWDAKIRNESEKWNFKPHLETCNIYKYDFKEWAIEEEMKELPY